MGLEHKLILLCTYNFHLQKGRYSKTSIHFNCSRVLPCGRKAKINSKQSSPKVQAFRRPDLTSFLTGISILQFQRTFSKGRCCLDTKNVDSVFKASSRLEGRDSQRELTQNKEINLQIVVKTKRKELRDSVQKG